MSAHILLNLLNEFGLGEGGGGRREGAEYKMREFAESSFLLTSLMSSVQDHERQILFII